MKGWVRKDTKCINSGDGAEGGDGSGLVRRRQSIVIIVRKDTKIINKISACAGAKNLEFRPVLRKKDEQFFLFWGVLTRYPRMFVIPKCSLSPKIRRELIYPPQANSFSPNVRYPQNQFAEGNIHSRIFSEKYFKINKIKFGKSI